MKIINSKHPAQEAGEYISELMAINTIPTLCLLAGGSALEILKYIQGTEATKVRTIFMMGDERVSRERADNNYLQLMDQGLLTADWNITDTSYNENSAEKYINKLNQKLKSILDNKVTHQIISINGLGNDGHTAGIFPMEDKSFQATYRDDLMYTLVPKNGSRGLVRATLTPAWYKARVDTLIGYAKANGKETMLNELIKEEKPMYKQPAQLLKQHSNSYLFTDYEVK